jgi:hypothetical protein
MLLRLQPRPSRLDPGLSLHPAETQDPAIGGFSFFAKFVPVMSKKRPLNFCRSHPIILSTVKKSFGSGIITIPRAVKFSAFCDSPERKAGVANWEGVSLQH